MSERSWVTTAEAAAWLGVGRTRFSALAEQAGVVHDDQLPGVSGAKLWKKSTIRKMCRTLGRDLP